jgi:hypothetical protein
MPPHAATFQIRSISEPRTLAGRHLPVEVPVWRPAGPLPLEPPVAPLEPSELVLLPAASGLVPEFWVWLIVVPGDDELLPAEPSEFVFLLAWPVDESPGCIVVSAASAPPATMVRAAAMMMIFFILVSSLMDR